MKIVVDDPSSVTGLESKFGMREARQLSCIRGGMFMLLTILATGLGCASFFLLRFIENDALNEVFESSADQVSKRITHNLESKLGAAAVVNHTFAYAIQDGYIGQLPNVTLPGFDSIMNSLSQLSLSRGISFNPIVTQSQRESWEAYAVNNVHLLEGPDSLTESTDDDGSWTVQDGIFWRDNNGVKGPTPTNLEHSIFPDIMTPVWQIAPISTNAPAVMLDVHSYPDSRTEMLDKTITDKTAGFTDIIVLVQDQDVDRPSTILYSPITSLEEGQPVVGHSAHILSWDDVLRDALPSYISGIQCVLSTSAKTYTLLFSDGDVLVQGQGDLHDRDYDSDRKVLTGAVTAVANLSPGDYTIVLYPTDELYNKYITYTPTYVCVSVFAVIALTAAVVLLYDFFVTKRGQVLVKARVRAENATTSTRQELETKKSFVRYIAHEIRTPLNTVKMGLQVLEQDFVEEKTVQDLLATVDDIKDSCNSALEVVNDFLLFDKIASGKLALDLRPCNVFEFVEGACKPFFIQARQCGISMVVENELSAVDSTFNQNVNVDSYKLTQVMRNMVSNAIKFTPKCGTVKVRVRRASHYSELGGVACFVVDVIDNGAGISKPNQQKLFKEIVQFDAGKLQNGGGSGLGMYISYGIMQQHNGHLGVWSEGEGFGSTFTMAVRVVQGECKNGEEGRGVAVPDPRSRSARDDVGGSSLLQFLERSPESAEDLNRKVANVTQSPAAAAFLRQVSNSSPTSPRSASPRSNIPSGVGRWTPAPKSAPKPGPKPAPRSGPLPASLPPPLPSSGGGGGGGRSQPATMSTVSAGVAGGVSVDDAAAVWSQPTQRGGALSESESPPVNKSHPAPRRKHHGGGTKRIVMKGGSRKYLGSGSDSSPPMRLGSGGGRAVRGAGGGVTVEELASHEQAQAQAVGGGGNANTISSPGSHLNLPPGGGAEDGTGTSSLRFKLPDVCVPLESPPVDYSPDYAFRSLPQPQFNASRESSSGGESSGEASGESDQQGQAEMGSIPRTRTPPGAGGAGSGPGAQQQPSNSSSNSKVSAPQLAHCGIRLHILVVDDSAMNRKMLTRLLTRAKGEEFTCEEASNGLEAVEAVQRSLLLGDGGVRQFDVIIMDYSMPGMSGPEALLGIRGAGYKGLAVGVTGHVDQMAHKELLASGADAVLVKPLSFAELKNIFRGRFVSSS